MFSQAVLIVSDQKVLWIFIMKKDPMICTQSPVKKSSLRECSRKMKGGMGRLLQEIILLRSVAALRKKLFKTTYTTERSVHTNSESC